MPLYGSVDLHSTNSYVAVTDEADRLICHKRLPNRLEELGRFFEPFKEILSSIALESTYNGYWVMDGLIGLGYSVKLVNTWMMQEYSGLKYTDDKSDCLWLNRMNRLGVLPTGYIYPREDRPVRDLLRKRGLLVRVRTKIINSLKHQSMTWSAINIPRKEVFDVSEDEVNALFQDPALRFCANTFAETIQYLTEKIKKIESFIHKKAKEDELVRRLRLLRGIGPILSWTIRYETGDIGRFPSVKNFLSYCGLVESKRMSNFKIKGRNHVKNRNRYLRWALAEGAVASLADPSIKKYHDRLVKKKGPIKAKAILSSKMARMAYFLMKDPSFVYDQRRLFNMEFTQAMPAVSRGLGAVENGLA